MEKIMVKERELYEKIFKKLGFSADECSFDIKGENIVITLPDDLKETLDSMQHTMLGNQ